MLPCASFRPTASRASTLAAAGFASLSSVTACGQSLPPGVPAVLDPIVVVASRTPQRLLDLVADVTVIGRDEIARSGMDGIVALLSRQPGVEITQNGGPGSTSGVFLRGANATQTLVLIDGMRVGSASSGETALEAIPLDQIERIEILRGPASSLYGADAIGGVIQVFTRRGGAGLRANASISYGTYDTWTGAAGISGGSAAANGSVQIAGARSNGFDAIVNPANFSYDPDRDGYRNASVSAQGELQVAERHTASIRYFRSHLDNQFDAGDGFDDRTVTTLASWQAALTSRFLPTWTSRVSAGDGSDDSVSELASGSFPFTTHQHQYAWQNDVVLPAGALTVALERREERVDTDAALPVDERDTNSITGIYRIEAGPHAVQANLRHDDSNQFGGRTTGALAWGYRFAPGWRVSVSGGNAFRPPTFNDLYFPGFSNPNLRPETSRNVEAGLHRSGQLGGAYVQAHAIAYRNRVDDLIVFECDADFDCLPQNVAKATLEGLTLEADAQWPDVTLRGSIDLQSPTDDETGHLLPRRARRHASVALTRQFGPARLVAEVLASSQRFDDAENTRRMGGYAVVNLTLEYALDPRTTLFLRGDNVFDRDYQIAADFSTGGARIFAGLRWRL